MNTTDTLSQFNTFMSGLRSRYAALKEELAKLEKIPGLLDGTETASTGVGNPRRKKPGPRPGRKPGKVNAPKVAKAKNGFSEVPDKATLKELLKEADGGRMNRKALNGAGYSLKSAILIAKENTDDFGFKQNKAQGGVWLSKKYEKLP